MPKRAANQAFTLIELSIVLVVIGLLVGGVMAGQSLIKQALLRNLQTDVQKFKTAVMTFRDKYNCLPGDCANATTFWSNATNGNGNGFIQENCEIYGMWQMLGSGFSGLVPGAYNGACSTFSPWVTFPGTPLGGNSIYMYRNNVSLGNTVYWK